MISKPKDTKRILVTTKISPELHRLLKVIAAEKGMKIYEVLEEAIGDYAEKYKRK